METATKWLWDHKELRWAPDIAHLTIAGEAATNWFPKRIIDRRMAIHFKDWTPVFGRWSHRYARGFTRLGEGKVPLDDIWAWLIAEQGRAKNEQFGWPGCFALSVQNTA